jgi:sulfide:quinone oxidoreductase
MLKVEDIQAIADYCRVPGHTGIYVVGDAGSFPGPGWMPKQGHMADLQARAAVKNLLSDLAGESASHTFKAELICIVDTIDNGILVFRDPKRDFMLKGRLMHWSKRFFERLYLRKFH